MRKTMTRVIEIKSPIQIEVDLNHWVEKEKVAILDTTHFEFDNKKYVLVTYSKNSFCNF